MKRFVGDPVGQASELLFIILQIILVVKQELRKLWQVSASSDMTLKVWDTHTGKEQLTLRGHTGDVRMCAISPLGDRIVSASADKTVKVWDARTGVCLATLAMESALYACTFCPDGKHIVVGGDTGIYILRLLG